MKQAADYAFNKFDEIVPEEKNEYVKIDDEEKSSMEKLLDNENVKYGAKIATDIKNDIVDFINKPETKKTINNIKYSALNIADKSLDALLKILDDKKDE